MLKRIIAGSSLLCCALFSLPAFAVATQVIDDFESGGLGVGFGYGANWKVRNGIVPDDVDMYNAISAKYNGGMGPKLYYPPQGSWMVVLESGDPATRINTDFYVTSGATLEFSWFFSTTVSPYDGYDDMAGVVINGVPLTLITSGTTGYGVGEENTGWREFSLLLPPGPGYINLGLWVKNDAINYQFDSQFAVDNIRVNYPAVPVGPAWAMMVSGLGFFSLIARRKKALA